MVDKHYVILGAGISGLSLAYFLKKKHPSAKISVIEKEGRVGGWIESKQYGNFLFDMGPRSLRTKGKGAYTLELVEALGLQNEVISADPSAHIRYVYENQQLCPLPHSLRKLVFSPYLGLMLKAAWQDIRLPPQSCNEESIYSFAERHFGSEVAERFIDPLVSGIFAGDCRQLSVNACFPDWIKAEASHGSLIKSLFSKNSEIFPTSPWIKEIQKEALFSFREGMETLVHALSKHLQDQIQLNSPVKALRFVSSGVEVVLPGEQLIHADHVYSTVPFKAIDHLLDLNVEVPEMASVAVVSVGFNAPVLKQKGFGYLVPSREKEDILGVVWDSSAFPQQNRSEGQTRLTVMIDAHKVDDYETTAIRALKKHLRIENVPDVIKTRVAREAIPQYTLGHGQRIAQIQEEMRRRSQHITLLGTAFNGVAVNDCVAQAYEAAHATT